MNASTPAPSRADRLANGLYWFVLAAMITGFVVEVILYRDPFWTAELGTPAILAMLGLRVFTARVEGGTLRRPGWRVRLAAAWALLVLAGAAMALIYYLRATTERMPRWDDFTLPAFSIVIGVALLLMPPEESGGRWARAFAGAFILFGAVGALYSFTFP